MSFGQGYGGCYFPRTDARDIPRVPSRGNLCINKTVYAYFSLAVGLDAKYTVLNDSVTFPINTSGFQVKCDSFETRKSIHRR